MTPSLRTAEKGPQLIEKPWAVSENPVATFPEHHFQYKEASRQAARAGLGA